MRLTRLLVENFLSFDHFDLEPIAPGLTTIVGPNGSGKTNLVRVFDLVALALGRADDQSSQEARESYPTQPSLGSYAEARHHGTAEDRPIRVELGIELTYDDERAVVTTFVQAAVLSTLLARRSGTAIPDGPTLAAWTLEEVTPERLGSLMSGAVVLEHRAPVGNPWEVAYEFSLDDARYRWILVGRRSQRGITPVSTGGPGLPSWPTQVDLVQRLFPGVTGMAPDASPSPLSSFSLERLRPAPGEIVELLVQGSGGNFDPELEPFRRPARMLGFPQTWQHLVGDRVRPASGQFPVVTHSPHSLAIDRPGGRSSLVRPSCSNGRTDARRYDNASCDAKPAAYRRSLIVRERTLSADSRAPAFAAGVVIVERKTEVGALSPWFKKSGTACQSRQRCEPADVSHGFSSTGQEQHLMPLLVPLAAVWVLTRFAAGQGDALRGRRLRVSADRLEMPR